MPKVESVYPSHNFKKPSKALCIRASRVKVAQALRNPPTDPQKLIRSTRTGAPSECPIPLLGLPNPSSSASERPTSGRSQPCWKCPRAPRLDVGESPRRVVEERDGGGLGCLDPGLEGVESKSRMERVWGLDQLQLLITHCMACLKIDIYTFR